MNKALIWILPIIFVISGCAETVSSGSGGVFNPGGGPSGVLAINWVAPTEREDGTPLILSEIESYNLYYGNSPGDNPFFGDNLNVTSNSIYITDFPGGTYYFVITTVAEDGSESRISEEIEIII